MTADDYVNDVLSRMPAGTPRRAQIGTELRGHIAERMAQGRTLEDVVRDLGDPARLADSYLAEVPLIPPTHGRRFLAKFADLIVVLAIISMVALLLVGGAALLDERYIWLGIVEAILLGSLLGAMYTVVAEWQYGQTVGKYLCGLRVVRESGARISLGQSIVRQLPWCLQIGWIDAAFTLFTDRRQRAFELLSKTRVVRAEPWESQQPAFASEH